MNKIKIAAIILLASIVLAAIAKDVFFDTPASGKQKLDLSLKKHSGSIKTLTYRMHFLSLLPMGTLEFTTQSSGTETMLIFEASPRGGIMQDKIAASARLESHLSQDGDLPLRYVERTKYKEKMKDKTIDFDRKNCIAVRGERKIKIPQDTYDPVSAFHKILHRELAKGDRYSVRCISEDVIYVLSADVQDDTGGMLKILMEIKREDGTSGHGARFTVWVVKGAENMFLPVLFKSWTPVGYASVILDSAR